MNGLFTVLVPIFTGGVTGNGRKNPLSQILRICQLPRKGELLSIYRLAAINLPLSGEVASQSDDGEGSLPQQKRGPEKPIDFSEPLRS